MESTLKNKDGTPNIKDGIDVTNEDVNNIKDGIDEVKEGQMNTVEEIKNLATGVNWVGSFVVAHCECIQRVPKSRGDVSELGCEERPDKSQELAQCQRSACQTKVGNLDLDTTRITCTPHVFHRELQLEANKKPQSYHTTNMAAVDRGENNIVDTQSVVRNQAPPKSTVLRYLNPARLCSRLKASLEVSFITCAPSSPGEKWVSLYSPNRPT